jgi:hypothetical protein
MPNLRRPAVHRDAFYDTKRWKQRSVLFRLPLDEKVTELQKVTGATRSRIYNAALAGFFELLTDDDRTKAMTRVMELEAQID